MIYQNPVLDINLGIAAATLVATIISVALAYWIARRSGQLSRPSCRLLLGCAPERGYSGPPIRHTMYLVPESYGSGMVGIAYQVHNTSNVSLRNLRVSIEVDRQFFATSEFIKEALAETDQREWFSHPYFRTRFAALTETRARIEYEVDVLHPKTSLVAAEYLVCAEKNIQRSTIKFGNGFDHIVERLFLNPELLFFTVVGISCSAQDVKPKGATINVSVLGSSELERDFELDIEPDTKGIRSKKMRRSEGALTEILGKRISAYSECFWLGKGPIRAWVPWPLRISKTEAVEVIPFSSSKVRTKRKDTDQYSLYAGQPDNIVTLAISVPRRDYYFNPRWVDTISMVVLFNGGFVIDLSKAKIFFIQLLSKVFRRRN